MATTKIEWANKVWNPVTGCTPVSEGCRNCYAARMAKRLAGRFGYPAANPFKVVVHEENLDEPFRWKKPARVFVNSMGDLFHEFLFDHEESYLDDIFAVMALTPHITYQILTKRPQLMKVYLNDPRRDEYVEYAIDAWCRSYGWHSGQFDWPLPNVWLGMTAENQETADERIPLLLQTPAAVRFVSVEPMLGAVDLKKGHINLPVDWVICGGETGPSARIMNPDWVRDLRDQCLGTGVPFFFKGWGEWIGCEQAHKSGMGFDENNFQNGWTDEGEQCWRIGKKYTGRLLDGQEWNEFPEGKSGAR